MSDTDRNRFADMIWAFEYAQGDFEMDLEGVGLKLYEHYHRIGWDHYDCSIELYGVKDDVRLTPAQQNVIWDAGFIKCYVNHKDGWETHYHWTSEDIKAMSDGKPFISKRGWRRRWVDDPQAKTTRSVGAQVAPDNAGYYEISYWPPGWGAQTAEGWKDSGFMRVVPDPLDPGDPP